MTYASHFRVETPSEVPVRRSLRPGGWADRLIFGYMFRVITGVAAVITPGILIGVWGALNGWRLTEEMLWVFGAITTLMVLTGEALRAGVYESRIENERPDSVVLGQGLASNDILTVATTPRPLYRFAKRLIDVAIAFLALFLLVPLMILVALLIKFDSRGPILFRQRRIGYRGRHFSVFKFRTVYLCEELEKVGLANSRDGRAFTRVGRFLRRTSIDEIPQLFNVLTGSMTLVGPRPLPDLPEEEMDAFKSYRLLLEYARPGLTGLGDWRAWDAKAAVEYLLRRSIVVDLSILLKTLTFMIKG